MAAPTLQTADTKSGDAASSTTWTIDYPTNIAAGDLLFMVLSANGSATMTAPAGWSVDGDNLALPGGYFKKKATGSESGTFTVTLDVARAGTWLVYRITGWSGSIGVLTGWGSGTNILDGDVACTGGANGTSTSPNPPSLNPRAWDTDDTLWLSFCTVSSAVSVTGFPSGYTDTYSGGASATIGMASKATSGAASEDPGTFTLGSSVSWGAYTIAIRALFGPTIHHGDTQTGTVTSNSTTWTMTYPTNLVSGDLILVCAATDGTIGSPTWPSGFAWSAGSATAVSEVQAKKLSDGTETGTFNVTSWSSEQGAWMTLRISNWKGNIGGGLFTTSDGSDCTIAAGSPTTGTNNAPDPLSGNPSGWDVEDTLWIAICAVDTSRTFSAWPTNYSPGNNSYDIISGGAGGASLSVQYRRTTAASEDAGSWTISSADDWAVALLAVRPPAAASLVLTQGFTDFNDPGIV